MGATNIHYKIMSLDDIRNFPYYDLVQRVRERDEWRNLVDWLANSPQASMPMYNPMVMSKLFWTRDVSRENPFNTDAFLWIDGGHLCNDPDGLPPARFQLFKEYFDKLLITCVSLPCCSPTAMARVLSLSLSSSLSLSFAVVIVISCRSVLLLLLLLSLWSHTPTLHPQQLFQLRGNRRGAWLRAPQA